MPSIALRHDIVAERVADELLVYDPTDSSCHCLNAQATLVWEGLAEGCSPEAIIDRVAAAFPDVSERAADLVEATILELRKRRLVVVPRGLRMSRRKALEAMGLGLIATIVAPMPSAASSKGLSVQLAIYFANPNTWTGTGYPRRCNSAGTQATTSATQNCMAGLTSYMSSHAGQMNGFQPSNTSCGADPLSGVLKMFEVIYNCKGANGTIFICETQTINFTC